MTYHLQQSDWNHWMAMESSRIFKTITRHGHRYIISVFLATKASYRFLCDKFYLASARVYMQQILYDKFSYDKLHLLVWTCQEKVFIAAMREKL